MIQYAARRILIMIAFICYFFPAVLSLWLFETLTKNNLSWKECLFRFCSNALFINFICFGIKKFILHTAGEPICSNSADMLPIVAFNYLVIAIPVTVVLVFAEILLPKKISITVEENTNETTKKEKN